MNPFQKCIHERTATTRCIAHDLWCVHWNFGLYTGGVDHQRMKKNIHFFVVFVVYKCISMYIARITQHKNTHHEHCNRPKQL